MQLSPLRLKGGGDSDSEATQLLDDSDSDCEEPCVQWPLRLRGGADEGEAIDGWRARMADVHHELRATGADHDSSESESASGADHASPLPGGADLASDDDDSMPKLVSASDSAASDSDGDSMPGPPPPARPQIMMASLPRLGHSHPFTDGLFSLCDHCARSTVMLRDAAIARRIAYESIQDGLRDFEFELDALYCLQRSWRAALFRRATRRLLASAHASHARSQLMLIGLAMRALGLW